MINRRLVFTTLTIAAVVLIAWSGQQATSPTGHVKWEYKFAKIGVLDADGKTHGPEDVAIQLTKLGEDGWELSAMQYEGASTNGKPTGDCHFNCYLKRAR